MQIININNIEKNELTHEISLSYALRHNAYCQLPIVYCLSLIVLRLMPNAQLTRSFTHRHTI